MLAERGQRLDEAVDLVQRALKLEPGNPSFLDSLGWAYYQQGKLDLADPPLTEAAAKMPNNSVIQDHLGDLRFKQRRFADAAAAWERSLTGDGESIDRAAIQKKISGRQIAAGEPLASMPRLSRSTPAVMRSLSLAASLLGVRAEARRAAHRRRHAVSPSRRAPMPRRCKECRGVRTMRATLGLSGRAGTTTLRGNVDAGFEAPDKIRLEGRHPLGRPVFILVAPGRRPRSTCRATTASCATPRRVDIVEALVGVPLAPGELRSLVSGCGFGVGEPATGRANTRRMTSPSTTGGRDDLSAPASRTAGASSRATRAAADRALFGLRQRPADDAAPAGERHAAGRSHRAAVGRQHQCARWSRRSSRSTCLRRPQPLTIEELRRAGPLGGE